MTVMLLWSESLLLICVRAQVAAERQQSLKALERKVWPMEELLCRLGVWLAGTEERLAALSPSAGEARQRQHQVAEEAEVSQTGFGIFCMCIYIHDYLACYTFL